MTPSAQVQSVEAIVDFKAALRIFGEEVREALASVDMETTRTINWLLRDQQSRCIRSVRDRQEEVTQARAELLRQQLSRISGEQPDCLEEKKAVRRAQQHLEEAERKVESCHQWGQHLLPKALGEFAVPARQLAARVEGDIPPAIAALDRILTALAAYMHHAPDTSARVESVAGRSVAGNEDKVSDAARKEGQAWR